MADAHLVIIGLIFSLVALVFVMYCWAVTFWLVRSVVSSKRRPEPAWVQVAVRVTNRLTRAW